MAVEVWLDDPKEEKALRERWEGRKQQLLKPVVTGSSFMENGMSPNMNIPMSLIQVNEVSESQMLPDRCIKFFNPIQRDDYENIVSSWTKAIADLSIKSRQIPADAAHKAL